MKKQNVSWKQVEEYVSLLAERIRELKIRDRGMITLVTIPRGGLPVATMLAHKLDIKDIRVVATTNGEITEVPYLEPDYKNTYIVVDEIHDTGETMIKLLAWLDDAVDGDVYSCALIYRDVVKADKPDFWAKTIKTNNWIVFPWEKK